MKKKTTAAPTTSSAKKTTAKAAQQPPARRKFAPSQAFLAAAQKHQEDVLSGGTGLNEKILQQAQRSGVLNISNRELDSFPEEIFHLNEENVGDSKWWEREEIKKIDASHNK